MFRFEKLLSIPGSNFLLTGFAKGSEMVLICNISHRYAKVFRSELPISPSSVKAQIEAPIPTEAPPNISQAVLGLKLFAASALLAVRRVSDDNSLEGLGDNKDTRLALRARESTRSILQVADVSPLVQRASSFFSSL